MKQGSKKLLLLVGFCVVERSFSLSVDSIYGVERSRRVKVPSHVEILRTGNENSDSSVVVVERNVVTAAMAAKENNTLDKAAAISPVDGSKRLGGEKKVGTVHLLRQKVKSLEKALKQLARNSSQIEHDQADGDYATMGEQETHMSNYFGHILGHIWGFHHRADRHQADYHQADYHWDHHHHRDHHHHWGHPWEHPLQEEFFKLPAVQQMKMICNKSFSAVCGEHLQDFERVEVPTLHKLAANAGKDGVREEERRTLQLRRGGTTPHTRSHSSSAPVMKIQNCLYEHWAALSKPCQTRIEDLPHHLPPHLRRTFDHIMMQGRWGGHALRWCRLMRLVHVVMLLLTVLGAFMLLRRCCKCRRWRRKANSPMDSGEPSRPANTVAPHSTSAQGVGVHEHAGLLGSASQIEVVSQRPIVVMGTPVHFLTDHDFKVHDGLQQH